MTKSGSFEPRDYQLRAVGELGVLLPQHRRIVAVAATGAGKCVAETSYVWSGGLRTIKDSWGRDRVATPSGEKHVSGWYDDGERVGIKATLRCGLEIDGTNNHRVWTRSADGVESWTRMDQLATGTYVGVSRGRADFGDISLDPEDAYTLGIMTADGCVSRGNGTQSLRIDKQLPVLQRVSPVISRWGLASGGRGTVAIVNKSPRHDILSAHSQGFKTWLHDSFGYECAYSEHRTIPRSVMLGTRETVCAYLRGYFDGDGWCDKNVCVATASSLLADQVHQLLTGLGIYAYRRVKKTTHLPSHQILIGDLDAFAKHIGITRYGLLKDLRYDELLAVPRNTNTDIVPGAAPLLRRLRDESTKKQKQFNLERFLSRGQNPSYDFLSNMAAASRNKEAVNEANRILGERYLWSPVKSLEASRVRRLDMEVPEGHAFVANGIANHNTAIASLMMTRACSKSKKIVFLAHRRELLSQAYDTLAWAGVPKTQLSIIRSGDKRYRPDAPIQIASVQTLINQTPPNADIVIVDECHRAGNDTTSQILSWYPNAYVVGLTATPVRGKRGLRGVFDHLYNVEKPSVLVQRGFIMAPEVYTVPDDLLPDTSKVKTDSGTGDYNRAQLSEVSCNQVLMGSIVDHYVEYGQNLPALLFAVDVKHSKEIRQLFLDRGIPAGHVDGTMGDEERAAQFAALESGEIRVLCSVDIAIEGLDMPCVRVGILARKTLSITVFLQSCGRIMRPYHGQPCLILDHAGNVHVHGMPDDDRDWKLDSPPKRAVTTKTCPKCFAIVRSMVTKCTGNIKGVPCTHVWTAKPADQDERKIENVDGKLAKVRRDPKPVDERQAYWFDLCRTAINRGYKPGWAKMQWKEKYGEWPPKTYEFPDRPQSKWDDHRRLQEWRKLREVEFRINAEPGWARDKFSTLFDETPESVQLRVDAAGTPPAPAGAPKVSASGEAPTEFFDEDVVEL